MLAEFVTKLCDLSKESAGAEPFTVEGVYDKCFVNVGGEITEHSVAAPSRNHYVHRIEDLVLFAEPKSMTWVDLNQVVTVIDDDDLRRHTVTMTIPPDPRFKALLTLSDIGMVQHRELVLFLRMNLKEELQVAYAGVAANRERLQGHQAGGRPLERRPWERQLWPVDRRRALGLKDLDEELRLRVPVWSGLDYTASITCEFIVDTIEAKFALKPREAELARVTNEARNWLCDQVTGEVQGAIGQGRP